MQFVSLFGAILVTVGVIFLGVILAVVLTEKENEDE